MKGDLYIHAGAPKCASSSVQAFLYKNAHTLYNHGFLLANKNMEFGNYGSTPIWFFQNLLQHPDKEEAASTISSVLKKLDGRTGIISSEALGKPEMAALFKSAAQDYNVHVLYIARRQDDWIYAAWKQWYSKTGIGFGKFVDRSLDKNNPRFLETLSAWRDVATTTSFLFLNDLSGEELYSRVLRWLDIDDDYEFVIPDRANEGFDYRISNLLSRHPAVFGSPHDRKIEKFIDTFSKLARKERNVLPLDLSSRIMRHFYAENVELLGEERAQGLMEERQATGHVIGSCEQPDERDFVIACLLEAAGSMAEELASIRERVDKMPGPHEVK